MAKLDMKKAMAAALNKGGSIFGNLEEIGAKDLNKEIKTGVNYLLGRFEVREKTKKHSSPYVTMELSSMVKNKSVTFVYSGYASAIGMKLAGLIKQFGTVDGTHLYFDGGHDVHGLTVFFKNEESEAGEYLDIHALEEDAEPEAEADAE